MKNILIFNLSPNQNKPLVDLFKELSNKGYSFYLALPNSKLASQFRKNNWASKKAWFGPKLDNKFSQLIFFVLLPFLSATYFIYLAYYKFKKKISAVICLAGNEKIIIAPMAAILKIKIIWFEDIDSFFVSHKRATGILFFLYKIYARRALIVTFNSLVKLRLKNAGILENRIKIIPLGIKLNQPEHQDNLFFELAHAGVEKFKRKFFTVGAISALDKRPSYSAIRQPADLDGKPSHVAGKHSIEVLLQAVRTCLTIIPNIQLIIVGDGEERKNLSWLAKKLEIDNIVWFVGEQAYLRKWLDSFDCFILAREELEAADFNIMLKAMAAGLPVIGPRNQGLEDIITDTHNRAGCLIEANNSETLARQIIKLYQDKRLRLKLGQAGRERVEKKFGIERVVGEWENVLSNW